MYPKVKINLSKLKHNVKVVRKLCEAYNMEYTAITKVFCGEPIITNALVEAGVQKIGDSRVDNLKKQRDINAEKWLIRPPMLSEAERTVKYADVSLNSELQTIKSLNIYASDQRKVHKVILMADLGDIREGFINYDELIEVAKEVTKLKHIELYGIGVNLTCFSFIQSNAEKMQMLLDISERIKQEVGVQLQVLSGGNSATLDLMMRGGIPNGVNNLRLGEGVLFGKERAKYSYLPDTYDDAFILECEIVELKEKPSLPIGEVGVDSYGNKPTFVDRGEKRLKAICALGKQDFDPEICTCVDEGIIMLGASSDHLMLDVTDSEKEYKVGDIVQLKLGYYSVLRAFTSMYVHKEYV